MLRQNRPEGGMGERVEYFAYVPTPANTRTHCYIAGPVAWYECHTKGRTKPCLHSITGGELACKQCEAGAPIEYIGYAPLYRETDSRPICVIVHEVSFEQTEKLKLHQRVLVGRNTHRGDPVYILPALDQNPRFVTSLKHRLAPVDLTRTLLRMWAIPDLVTWYETVSGVSVPKKKKITREQAERLIEMEETASKPETSVPLITEGLLNAVDHEAERSRQIAERAKRNAEFLKQAAKDEPRKPKR